MSQQNSPSGATVSPLVAQAKKLMKERDDLQARIDAIETELIELGSGTYSDDAGNTCQVVAASAGSVADPTFALDPQAEEKARALAGEEFKSLFDRSVTFVPCEGFEVVAPKLLTPAKARDLVALCRVPGKVTKGRKAYVKWPKAQN